MGRFSTLARIGAAPLSVLVLISMLESCRRGSREGGAAGSDTLDVPGSVAEGPGAGRQSSFEKGAAAPAAGAGGDSTLEASPAQTPTREESAAAYAACRDSVQVTLPDPARAAWPTVPDTMAPADTPGQYRIVAQVRPDSVSPGAPFLCVVRKDPEGWRVVRLEGGPS